MTSSFGKARGCVIALGFIVSTYFLTTVLFYSRTYKFTLLPMHETALINSNGHPCCQKSCSENTSNPAETELVKAYENFYAFSSEKTTDIEYFSEVKSPQDCFWIPPNLGGPIKAVKKYFPLSELNLLDFHVTTGGSYSPSECQSLQTTAIILPFRNRDHQLPTFLLHLHPLLQKQELDYTIFLVNQTSNHTFNKGILMNVGASEALQRGKYNCLIFHDVDHLPADDRNLYDCRKGHNEVIHMARAVEKFHYHMPYPTFFGGVVAIQSDHFKRVNGFSNSFNGWGSEDDDFYERCIGSGLQVFRFPADIARYHTLYHTADIGNEINPLREELMNTTRTRQPSDGLNSLSHMYTLNYISEEPLYTHMNIEIHPDGSKGIKPSAVHGLASHSSYSSNSTAAQQYDSAHKPPK